MATRVPVIIGANGNIRKIEAGNTIDPTYLPSRSLYSYNTEASNSGTSEETLTGYSFSLAANTLATNKDWIEYYLWGEIESGADIEVIKLRFGASDYVYDSENVDELSGVAARKWILAGTISRVSDTAITAAGLLTVASWTGNNFPLTYDVSSLNLSLTAYTIALRVIGSAASKITAKGCWFRYNAAP